MMLKPFKSTLFWSARGLFILSNKLKPSQFFFHKNFSKHFSWIYGPGSISESLNPISVYQQKLFLRNLFAYRKIKLTLNDHSAAQPEFLSLARFFFSRQKTYWSINRGQLSNLVYTRISRLNAGSKFSGVGLFDRSLFFSRSTAWTNPLVDFRSSNAMSLPTSTPFAFAPIYIAEGGKREVTDIIFFRRRSAYTPQFTGSYKDRLFYFNASFANPACGFAKSTKFLTDMRYPQEFFGLNIGLSLSTQVTFVGHYQNFAGIHEYKSWVGGVAPQPIRVSSNFSELPLHVLLSVTLNTFTSILFKSRVREASPACVKSKILRTANLLTRINFNSSSFFANFAKFHSLTDHGLLVFFVKSYLAQQLIGVLHKFLSLDSRQIPVKPLNNFFLYNHIVCAAVFAVAFTGVPTGLCPNFYLDNTNVVSLKPQVVGGFSFKRTTGRERSIKFNSAASLMLTDLFSSRVYKKIYFCLEDGSARSEHLNNLFLRVFYARRFLKSLKTYTSLLQGWFKFSGEASAHVGVNYIANKEIGLSLMLTNFVTSPLDVTCRSLLSEKCVEAFRLSNSNLLHHQFGYDIRTENSVTGAYIAPLIKLGVCESSLDFFSMYATKIGSNAARQHIRNPLTTFRAKSLAGPPAKRFLDLAFFDKLSLSVWTNDHHFLRGSGCLSSNKPVSSWFDVSSSFDFFPDYADSYFFNEFDAAVGVLIDSRRESQINFENLYDFKTSLDFSARGVRVQRRAVVSRVFGIKRRSPLAIRRLRKRFLTDGKLFWRDQLSALFYSL